MTPAAAKQFVAEIEDFVLDNGGFDTTVERFITHKLAGVPARRPLSYSEGMQRRGRKIVIGSGLKANRKEGKGK